MDAQSYRGLCRLPSSSPNDQRRVVPFLAKNPSQWKEEIRSVVPIRRSEAGEGRRRIDEKDEVGYAACDPIPGIIELSSRLRSCCSLCEGCLHFLTSYASARISSATCFMLERLFIDSCWIKRYASSSVMLFSRMSLPLAFSTFFRASSRSCSD